MLGLKYRSTFQWNTSSYFYFGQSVDLEEPEGEEEDCFLASMQDTLSRDLSL